MNCTSQPDSRAAGVTARHARVASPRAGMELMKAASRRCSSTLTGELGGRYVVPAKSANEPAVRLLLAGREKEPLTVYMNGFRAYDPLDDDERFHRESVTHANNEYVDGEIHVNACESHGSPVRPWLSPRQGVSEDKLTHYLRAFQL